MRNMIQRQFKLVLPKKTGHNPMPSSRTQRKPSIAQRSQDLLAKEVVGVHRKYLEPIINNGLVEYSPSNRLTYLQRSMQRPRICRNTILLHLRK